MFNYKTSCTEIRATAVACNMGATAEHPAALDELNLLEDPRVREVLLCRRVVGAGGDVVEQLVSEHVQLIHDLGSVP